MILEERVRTNTSNKINPEIDKNPGELYMLCSARLKTQYVNERNWKSNGTLKKYRSKYAYCCFDWTLFKLFHYPIVVSISLASSAIFSGTCASRLVSTVAYFSKVSVSHQKKRSKKNARH